MTKPPLPFRQPPVTASPTAFRYRQRFAGQHGFIEAGAALLHHAVGRHLVAGAHAQAVAELDVIDGNRLVAIGADADRRFRLQFDQLADRLRGLALGALLHVAAAEDEGDDGRRRLEIDVVVHARHAGQAVQVGGAGAHRDQRVHVGFALLGQHPGLLEYLAAAAEHHGAGQAELQQAQHGRAVHQHAGDHHRRRQPGGLDQALPRVGQPQLLALDDQAALGQGIHRPRLVAEFLHRGEELFARQAAFHRHRSCGEIHRGGVDTRIALQAHLDQQRAGGAGHAFDRGVAFLSGAIDRTCGGRRCRLGRGRGGDVADHGIDHGQQAFFGKLHGVEVQRHRSDLRHGAHVLHRAVLAQQDFEDVAALGLLHQRRRYQPHAAREAMDDAEVVHDGSAGVGVTASLAASAAMDLR
jgi:hypothetical protein